MLDLKKDEDLIGRLYNYKFGAATNYLRDDHPKEVHDLVKALAQSFGSPGLFDGDMATIIDAALQNIIPTPITEQSS